MVSQPPAPETDTDDRKPTPDSEWSLSKSAQTAHDHRRAGSLVRCSAAPLLLHDDRRTDLGPRYRDRSRLIGQANAAR
jgi:hypothetical protein